MDLAHLYTEKQLEKIEKRFAKEYKQAEKEVSAKLKAYLDGFAKREAKMLEKVANGEISYQRYTQWRIGQVAVGERWKKLRDELAEAYTKATVRNTQDIEAMLEDIFAESANRTMFSIEKGANVDTSFTLYDQNTVNRLVEEQPNLLPKPRVKIAKDKKWNQKKITSAVTQGILQGDSMGQIAKRMRGEISKGFSIEDVKDWQSKPMDKAMKELSRKISQSAIRNARTAVTGAENAGRLRGYEDAQDMGIKLQQQWVATLDNRTRHEHRELDGQIRDIDEPFEVDGDEIMYPADPSAEPHLVYNCRCTTIAVVEGHPINLDVRDTSVIGDYEEWKHGKKKEELSNGEQEKKPETNSESNSLKGRIDAIKAKNLSLEETTMEVGKEVAEEFDRTYMKPLQKEYNDTLEALKPYEKEYNDLKNKASEIADSAFNGDFEKYGYKTFQEAWKDAGRLRDLADGKYLEEDFSKLRKKKNTLMQRIEGRYDEGGAKALKELLSKVRPMGVGDNDIKAHFRNTRSKMWKVLNNAYDHYPTDWVTRSVAHGTLQTGKVDRGYYNHYYNEIKISGHDEDSFFETAIHELGHRFERIVPDILSHEASFYDRRTAGESLEWLGAGYSRSEVTRKDNFLSPYMGKDYGRRAFELVSMGFQYAYTNPFKLAKDPDMQRWILGILATL